MERDIKEVIGVLMHVLAGGEVSRGEVEDLAFEAEGALQAAVNEAYIKLLEFAYDRDARGNDRALDGKMRSALQQSLDEIVRLADPSVSNAASIISGFALIDPARTTARRDRTSQAGIRHPRSWRA